jgi:hypothetical protein
VAHYFKESSTGTPPTKLRVGAYTKIPLLEYTPDWTSDPASPDRPDAFIWCYVNLTYSLKPWYLGGRIRFRMVRAKTDPPDSTAFRNVTLLRESCSVIDASKLKTASPDVSWIDPFWWTGAVVKGRKMWAEIDSDDCFNHLVVTTRYIKVEKWLQG